MKRVQEAAVVEAGTTQPTPTVRVLSGQCHLLRRGYPDPAGHSVVCAADDEKCDPNRDHGFLLGRTDGTLCLLWQRFGGSVRIQAHQCDR